MSGATAAMVEAKTLESIAAAKRSGKALPTSDSPRMRVRVMMASVAAAPEKMKAPTRHILLPELQDVG